MASKKRNTIFGHFIVSSTTPPKAKLANSSLASPDIPLINDLLEVLESSPSSIETRKLLIQQLISCGWNDAAREHVQEILRLDPKDIEAKAWTTTLQTTSSASKSTAPEISSDEAPAPLPPTNFEEGKLQLCRDYEALRSKAEKLLHTTVLLRDLAKTRDESAVSQFEKRIANLTAFRNGQFNSVLQGLGTSQPGSIRSVAHAMETSPDDAVDIAFKDFEAMALWLCLSTGKPVAQDTDDVREALMKRATSLISALPTDLKSHASTALMHVEHEVLHKSYVCEETMYGDPVADIPQGRFLVTEDGYPWDMEELVQALTSNGGAMRNPLSRLIFSEKDIRAIIQHPIGKQLAALRLEQSELKQGIRSKTIDQLDKMAVVLLADQSSDQMESRHVVDGFIAYLATLPSSEQEALGKLRVPATDSHTGLQFDTSIGDAIKDAQGNRICFHKAGDLIRQAVKHLRG